ncbi:hypothetical protein [Parasphingorhabdus pacifica]
MEAETVETGSTREHSATRRNPLIRGNNMRRAVATGIVGAAVTASTLLGAGSAAAEGSVVLRECTGETESTAFDQSVIAGPQALDAKVEQAMLLVYPLQFDRAAQARQEFLNSGPVPIGTVTEEQQTFAGQDLADAFTDQLSTLPAAGDRGDSVHTHVRNLAAIGCVGGARVPGQEPPPPPPPPPPEPEQEQEPAPEPAPEPTEQPEPSTETSETAVPGTTSGAPSTYGAAAPVRVLPPDYQHVPGSLPPWADTRFGEAPGMSPEIGDLLRQSEEQQRAEDQKRDAEVRAAGNAEAMPTPAYQGNRVELPVLLAAISLAGVTAALVRTWVLRRS